MKTITHTGGTTFDTLTYVGREVPIIRNFPAFNGTAKTVNVKTYLHTDSGSSLTATYTVYLFKTFSGNAEYWDERTDNMYQYPGDNAHWLKTDYIGDILASATFTSKITEGEVNCALALTDYGKDVANWSGDVFLAVMCENTHLYWMDSTLSTITLEYNNGIVRYGIDGAFVACEMYKAVGGTWKQVQPHKATGGEYKEIGG